MSKLIESFDACDAQLENNNVTSEKKKIADDADSANSKKFEVEEN